MSSSAPREEAARYGREYQDLVNLYYQVENETKRAALQRDQTPLRAVPDRK